MAINKQRVRDVTQNISAVFDSMGGTWSTQQRQWIQEYVFGSAIRDIEELIAESRPPTLYIIGRSGHGKSSLINALSGQDVADVSDIKPCTPEAESYRISFSDVFSEWHVIDSRGIFETTTPHGATSQDALDQVKSDIRHHRPDIILHVIAASEARALQQDCIAFNDIQHTIEKETGSPTPSVMVLTKVDALGNPREWPAETFPRKAGAIGELLDYIRHDVLTAKSERIDANSTLKGYMLTEHPTYIGVLPICALHGDTWNITTLSEFIGTYLPESTKLDYYQGLKRKDLLRKFSTSIIRRFTAIAATIGLAPIPIVDMAVLIPLQLLLIAVIAGLSCRPFSIESVTEFTVATGINLGTTLGARQLAQYAVEFIPVVGVPLHGFLAGATTYTLGKTAEAYFFNNEVQHMKSSLTLGKEWMWGKLTGKRD